jgi:hypothetical protein
LRVRFFRTKPAIKHRSPRDGNADGGFAGRLIAPFCMFVVNREMSFPRG